ncbi:MAG: RsmB/NOP family class I SAM-dependent RNA methyltransferase [Candidatus Omnitrophica bacterium]|nr:RsmB/NOP family class I SAM-dependent RNA methyltransferase [Candidatus Omnitrophota bacterium]
MIAGEVRCGDIIASFSRPDILSVRVNTIKTTREEMISRLKERHISFREIPWSGEALVLEGIPREELGRMDLINDGSLYRQSLSSMLPALVLAPRPGERVLDMCAAPGSKTTQMAALMNNEGEIVAVEAIRGRYYRLRSVVEQMGATNVALKLTDARRFHSPVLFDRILVDAPCSSEGRFKINDPETYAYWSPRKIKEMVRKQRGLLLHASRLLKPGGVLVYSTCTFAPEENEGVIDWLLRKTQRKLTVQPVFFEGVTSYPALLTWQKKSFNRQVENCLRVLPSGGMEGFFIAKIEDH